MPLPVTILPRKRRAPFRLFMIVTACLFAFLVASASLVQAQRPVASQPDLEDDFIYLSLMDEGWRAYLMNADGSERRPVTTQINFPRSNVTMYSAVFSPDRAHIIIALVMNNNSGSEHRLYRVDADGKGLKLLWRGQADYLNPIWSPKGDRIAFSTLTEALLSETYLINSDGSGLTRLPIGEAQSSYFPDWSASGEQILFNASINDDRFLSVVNVDGSEFYTIIEGYYYGMRWSPVDPQLAFVSEEDGDLYLANADGSKIERVTDMGQVFGQTWSPDGTKIAFVSIQNEEANLYMINPDGSELTRLTDVGAKSFACPHWLPNGEQLIVLMAPRDRMFYDTETNLYAVAADGSGVMTRLTDMSEAVSLPNCGALFG